MNRASEKKNLIRAGVVIICIALVAAYIFWDADTDQGADEEQVAARSNYTRDKADEHGQKKMASSGHHVMPDPSGAGSDVVEKQIQAVPVIDYNALTDTTADAPVDKMMKKRLQELGIKKSLDMIVRSDESFVVGGKKVSMADILEKAFVKNNRIFESRIMDSEETVPENIKEYGIYVVQPGDNIWNIHFNILKEYYASREIAVAPDADEPMNHGQSSGVGKILKFSETMVIIYNLIDEQIVPDINLLEPLSKIVVYNMEEVFALLAQINYETVNQIHFDGRTIWIPGSKS